MRRNVQRQCPVCGAVYQADAQRLKFGRQTTCSRACSYRLRATKKERRQTLRCGFCQRDFTRCVSHVKAKHGASFCSARCQYAARGSITPRIVSRPYVRVAPVNRDAIRRAHATRKARNNYGHSDATVAKLREATARNIAQGRIRPISRLEDEVAKVLDVFGIGYERQALIRGERGRYVAVVDFLLAGRFVIEVNGTFWHADPRVYPGGAVHPAQHRSAERWSRKVAALAAGGYTLAVVWERDFRDDPTEAVRVALRRI